MRDFTVLDLLPVIKLPKITGQSTFAAFYRRSGAAYDKWQAGAGYDYSLNAFGLEKQRETQVNDMSVQTIEPQLAKPSLSRFVQIRELELFVVNQEDQVGGGYRVHLWLSTDAGLLTCDTRLEAYEKPADWVTWSSCFRKILNACESHDLDGLMQKLGRDSVHARLAAAALRRIAGDTEPTPLDKRSLLLEQATHYICYFK
ncbi:hypothetical protein [Cohnella sp. JJ-181]|uniref:hypothetical protein n=1 Tax=Cohnella rhizoplanae TaxID=2974897 RepID=UPI0022FF5FE3|nr:hypothetical protein [Cohnella sp. JJ-181]CAI6050871.1 hypothetical protein COHCIP112018_01471 [Cohnella sp. JJ-181]